MCAIALVVERTGNTSSASIPVALVDAIEHARLSAGKNVVFAGFGAGMTCASAAVAMGVAGIEIEGGERPVDLVTKDGPSTSHRSGGRREI
jgi:hypothetical protein